jgi:hypothetical protein
MILLPRRRRFVSRYFQANPDVLPEVENVFQPPAVRVPVERIHEERETIKRRMSPQLWIRVSEWINETRPADEKLHRMAEGLTRRGRKDWSMKQYDEVVRMNPELRKEYYHFPVLNAGYFEDFRVLAQDRFGHIDRKDMAYAKAKYAKKFGTKSFPSGTLITMGALKDRAPAFAHTMGPRGPRRWAIQKIMVPARSAKVRNVNKSFLRRANPLNLTIVGNPAASGLKKSYKKFHSANPKSIQRIQVKDGKQRVVNLVRVGHCVDFEVFVNGKALLVHLSRKPHLYFIPGKRVLVCSHDKVNSSNLNTILNREMQKGKGKIFAISYKAPEHSSKRGTPFRHKFGSPRPSWYATKDKRIILVKGGSFRVSDWMYH